jgi:hypothetical protein
MYRASKGMGTVLPSVGRKVYQRIELMLMSYDDILLLVPQDDPIALASNTNIRWSTRLTASVLAGFVTLSYTLGGALRVGKQFCSTLLHKSSLPQAFESAAQQVLQNEVRMNRLLQNGGGGGSSTFSDLANGLNGTSGGGGGDNNNNSGTSSSSGLSP